MSEYELKGFVNRTFHRPAYMRQKRRIGKAKLMMVLRKLQRQVRSEGKLTPYVLSKRPWLKEVWT